MTYDSLSVSEVIPARPERIYSAWLSSDEHTAFTGDKAVVEPFVGGKHSAFDGYAVGRTVDLQPGHRIVQTWRAEDFPVGSPDSRVEVTLEETVGGTMLTILHTEIPSGQGSQYRDGWLKYYLEPLKGYFVVDQRAKTNGVPKRAPKPVAKDGAKAARSTTRAARAPSARRAAAKKRTASAKRPKKTKTKGKKTTKAARPKATKPKRGGKSRGGAKRRTRR